MAKRRKSAQCGGINGVINGGSMKSINNGVMA
jgi:hypothetical protein